MKPLHWMSIVLLSAGLSACWHEKAPPPAPDYLIVGELPTEIKVLQGTAAIAFKKVYVRRSGSVPATSATIPAPANVALGVGAMNPGIAVAFIGPAAGRPVFDVISQISIANTLARGTYPVVITGTAPPVAAKTVTTQLVHVYGAMDGGAYIEVSPSEITISPGGTTVVSATVKNIPPHVGFVTITYPGAGTALPTGVTVAGQTEYTFALGGPAGNSVTKQFILVAGDNAAGTTFPQAEVRTGPAVAGAKTDTAAHIVAVQ